MGGSTLAVGGASIAGALYWEYRAQQEYFLFRKAEQFGEDTVMTEHFFYTQQYDRRRDGAVAVATAAFSAGLFAALWQRFELRRFAKARAQMRGSQTAGSEAGK